MVVGILRDGWLGSWSRLVHWFWVDAGLVAVGLVVVGVGRSWGRFWIDRRVDRWIDGRLAVGLVDLEVAEKANLVPGSKKLLLALNISQ